MKKRAGKFIALLSTMALVVGMLPLPVNAASVNETSVSADAQAASNVDASHQAEKTSSPDATAMAEENISPDVVTQAEEADNEVSLLPPADNNESEPSASPSPSVAYQAADQASDQSASTNVEMPALTCAETTDAGVAVSIAADAGTFPAGTTVSVKDVDAASAVAAAKNATDDDVVDAAAVDITFINAEGAEVEPANGKNVHVAIHPAQALDGDDYNVVHIQDNGNASALSQDNVAAASAEGATFNADSFSIYTVIGTKPFPATMTYRFFDSTDATTPVSVQKVKDGDTLKMPEIPQSKGGNAFIGWFEKGSDTAFSGFGEVSGAVEGKTVDLYAHYVASHYTVRYLDQSGYVVSTQNVSPGTKINIQNNYPFIRTNNLTTSHVGWALAQVGWALMPSTPDDALFPKAVSGEMTVNSDVTLYPIIKYGHWVHFESNGGSVFRDVFVAIDAPDTHITNPGAPVKDGYTFTGWFTDSDCTIPYDFDTEEVASNLTLYAGYRSVHTARYTVRYWAEYQSDVATDTWGYRKITTEVREGTPGTPAQYEPDLVYNSPYSLSRDGYSLNTDKTENVDIKADGSTIYDVYYDANAFSVIFYRLPAEDGTQITLSWDGGTGENHFPKIKYTASMKPIWDKVESYNGHLFGGPYRFLNDDSGYPLSIEAKNDLSYMVDHNLDNLTYQWLGSHLKKARYWYETLDGKAPDGSKGSKNISQRSQYDDENRTYYDGGTSQTNVDWLGSIYMSPSMSPGFTIHPEWSDGNYYIDYPYLLYFNQVVGTYGLNNTKDVNLYNYSDDGDGYLDVYLTRNSYNLSFITNGGDSVDSQTVLYGDSMSKHMPANYVANKTTRTDANGRQYIFKGWYTSPDCEDGDLFDASAQTMPAQNLALYAKWESPAYTVTFDSNGGSAIDPADGIAYGDQVTRPADPTRDGYIFLGWTYNGSPYGFDSGVSSDMTLVAQWRSIDAYPVKYDLNGGVGTAPQDNHLYYLDTEATALGIGDVQGPNGKNFIGWKSDGDGKIYYPGASVPMEPAAYDSEGRPKALDPGTFNGMTLTAQWADAQQTTQLTYNFNFDTFGIQADGEQSKTATQLNENDRVTLADISSLRAAPAGYTFGGWYLDPACQDGPYTTVQVDSTNESANVVYAKWVKVAEPVSPEEPATPETPAAPVTPSAPEAAETPQAPATTPAAVTSQAEETPATADNSGTATYIAIMLGSLSGLVACAARKKKIKASKK